MWFVMGLLSFLGRAAFAVIFLGAAVEKIQHFNATAATMEKAGIPEPRTALIGAIAFLIVGGLLVLVGYRARIGAALLLIFLALATYYFHAFWKFERGTPEFGEQQIQFMKNLALAGMALFIIGNGAGGWSVGPHPSDDEEYI